MWKTVASLGLFAAALGIMAMGLAPQGPPTCTNAAAGLTQDYAYVIGSADFSDPDGEVESGSTFRWLINGTPTAAEEVAEHLMLHLDDSLDGCGGETPNLAQGVSYTTGKWGSALALSPGGCLSFEREGNLDLTEGTIEMWVAMRADGDDPVFSSQWHVLFTYQAPDGDSLHIAQAADTGILYAGGVVDGQWQSAYGSLASTRAWQAGEWHHLAFTYSDSQDFMRFYVDGALTADTNEGHYWPPSTGGADFPPDMIRQLRLLNPHIRVLTSINAVEHPGLPDDYYLKDIYGNRVEVWPGSYRLNLTKPYVAEHQAHYAYQLMLESDLMFDGVFFDNVFTTQSWLTEDIYGNPFLVDADEDGVQDDPEVLDAAWRAGVFHEMETFRALMPAALVMGHAMDIYEPGIAEIFNGISVGFWTADVIEGRRAFVSLWDRYAAWHELARPPAVTMIESSPPDQIAYGYDYAPWENIPPSTLEFARTYYPYVRFGLALTLMNDGYFAHEFGDTWHGNDWWYDELDFDLGYPLGPAERVDLGDPPENQIVNGGFEEPIVFPWNFWANAEEGCVASVSRDTTEAAVGAASARIDISATSGTDWHIELAQYDRSLEQGVSYDVTFWAKADAPRSITLSAQKGSPDWRNYGLWRRVSIDTEWQEHTVSFEANETTDESRHQFVVGESTGTVWLDDVRLNVRPPDVYRREYTNGLVLLNGSQEVQQVHIGSGYRRLVGQQAPLYEVILDDDGAAFSTTGDWAEVTYDSGEWQAEGPFYHDWGEGCHERTGAWGEARWDLDITAADTYTITVWWPAAPQAPTWSQNVTYEVVAGGEVLASTTLDQRFGGDQWHLVAEVPLAPEDGAYVRMTCPGSAPCIADALHLRSQARYNDGSLAETVTLQPMDGIVLARACGHPDCFGDLDGDCDVDVADVLEVASRWHCRCGDGCYDAHYDVDGDCNIDIVDIMLVAIEWGKTCE